MRQSEIVVSARRVTIPVRQQLPELPTILDQQPRHCLSTNQDPPRSVGEVRVSVRSARPTVVSDLRQGGSLRVLFPRSGDASLQAVLVNTAGGMTGGDDLAVSATLGEGSSLTLTTQAAERAYRSEGERPGRVRTRLTVAEGGHVNWLPQETILFEGCNLCRALDVELRPNASAMLVEPFVFGRTAMGEVLTRARFSDRISVRRAGRTVYHDRIAMAGNIARNLRRPGIAGGAGAGASLVFLAPSAQAKVEPVRALLNGSVGRQHRAERPAGGQAACRRRPRTSRDPRQGARTTAGTGHPEAMGTLRCN